MHCLLFLPYRRRGGCWWVHVWLHSAYLLNHMHKALAWNCACMHFGQNRSQSQSAEASGTRQRRVTARPYHPQLRIHVSEADSNLRLNSKLSNLNLTALSNLTPQRSGSRARIIRLRSLPTLWDSRSGTHAESTPTTISACPVRRSWECTPTHARAHTVHRPAADDSLKLDDTVHEESPEGGKALSIRVLPTRTGTPHYFPPTCPAVAAAEEDDDQFDEEPEEV